MKISNSTQWMLNQCQMEHFGDPDIIRMAEAAVAWFRQASTGDPNGKWLTILGTTGTGKSMVARRLWEMVHPNHCWKRCQFCHFPIYWPEFVDNVKSGEFRQMRSDVYQWPVCLLDDIGAGRDTSGFAADMLNTMAEKRLGKWTIITSNLSFQDIAKLDPRIADRMCRNGNVVVQVKTKSYAVRTKQ